MLVGHSGQNLVILLYYYISVSFDCCCMQTNPSVPVVENLEDIWLVSKLQNERKAAQSKQEHVAQQRKYKQVGHLRLNSLLSNAFAACHESFDVHFVSASACMVSVLFAKMLYQARRLASCVTRFCEHDVHRQSMLHAFV